MLILYISLKIVLYSLVCTLAVSMLKLNVINKLTFGIQWGLARLFLGFLVGFIIVMALGFMSKYTDNQVLGYLFGFGFIRYFEWLFLVYLISIKHPLNYGLKTQLWILMGMFSSMFMDFLVIELDLLEGMKFFC